mmetsp:Transcript_52276/g.138077  ORF Transcript_52276/g.138077 Transcript_52276/m.138077 type:complete len:617 (+) Transcript_52276:3-1853(+)
MVVFVVLCQGVQMFMSYDGGAVPASLDTMQELMNNSWSQVEIGLLGAMDKVGMVAASLPWGWALQRCNAKLLLSISLLLNAFCTFVFGLLRSKNLMFLTRFMMGVTQSLQGVWGTVWTVTVAPPDHKTMWLGLGAVSAGVGNGIGTCVAGFGTANGLPFAFAFQLAGVVLVLLWVAQVFMPARWLRIQLPTENVSVRCLGAGTPCTSGGRSGEGAQALRSDATDEDMGTQLRAVLANRVYLWTALAISLIMFEVSGIQYLWTRVFTEVWATGPGPNQELSKNWVTMMFIVVTGLGGGAGIAAGPWLIDSQGGFHTPGGVVKSLRIIWVFQAWSAVGGVAGVFFIYGKQHSKGYSGEWGDVWLWGTWASILLIYAAQNACVAALCGINVEVIPEHRRSFASGTEMTVRNVLGYIMGPLLPSLVMSLNAGWLDLSWQLSCGLAFVFLLNIFGVIIVGWARSAARRELDRQRREALEQLREAFQAQDLGALEKAVANGRRVSLERWKDGEAVLGMANEVIGQCAVDVSEELRHASLAAATHAELRERARGLQRTVAEQQTVIEKQLEEIKWLQARCHESSDQPRDWEVGGDTPPGPCLPREPEPPQLASAGPGELLRTP